MLEYELKSLMVLFSCTSWSKCFFNVKKYFWVTVDTRYIYHNGIKEKVKVCSCRQRIFIFSYFIIPFVTRQCRFFFQRQANKHYNNTASHEPLSSCVTVRLLLLLISRIQLNKQLCVYLFSSTVVNYLKIACEEKKHIRCSWMTLKSMNVKCYI